MYQHYIMNCFVIEGNIIYFHQIAVINIAIPTSDQHTFVVVQSIFVFYIVKKISIQ